MPGNQRLGLGAAMRLDHPDHDIGSSAAPRRPFGQHLIGFAHARRGAEENLQPPARFLLGKREERIGVWALIAHVGLLALIMASCRLRAVVKLSIQKEDVDARLPQEAE